MAITPRTIETTAPIAQMMMRMPRNFCIFSL
jgi:hypothetical protein